MLIYARMISLYLEEMESLKSEGHLLYEEFLYGTWLSTKMLWCHSALHVQNSYSIKVIE